MGILAEATHRSQLLSPCLPEPKLPEARAHIPGEEGPLVGAGLWGAAATQTCGLIRARAPAWSELLGRLPLNPQSPDRLSHLMNPTWACVLSGAAGLTAGRTSSECTLRTWSGDPGWEVLGPDTAGVPRFRLRHPQLAALLASHLPHTWAVSSLQLRSPGEGGGG